MTPKAKYDLAQLRASQQHQRKSHHCFQYAASSHLASFDHVLENSQLKRIRGVQNEITANGILNRSQYLRIQEVVALLNDFKTHLINVISKHVLFKEKKLFLVDPLRD